MVDVVLLHQMAKYFCGAMMLSSIKFTFQNYYLLKKKEFNCYFVLFSLSIVIFLYHKFRYLKLLNNVVLVQKFYLNNIIVMADVNDSNTGIVFRPYDNYQKDTKKPSLKENTMVEKQIEDAVDGMLYLLLVLITLK